MEECIVDVYFMELLLSPNGNLDDAVKKKFSKNDTLKHIRNVMGDIFNISADAETRVWYKPEVLSLEEIARLDSTVQEANLFAGQLLIIEIKNQDGTWPGPTIRSTLCQEKKLVSENVITPRVDVYSLNQIGREIEKIQVFESGMEAKRKVLKERHRTEMNTIMEKQKKENNEWDVNILKKKELVNEIQGILIPLVHPLKHSIGHLKRSTGNVVTHTMDTNRIKEIANEIENIQTFELSVGANSNDLKEKHSAEMTTIMEEQKKENNDFESECAKKIKKKKELVNKLQDILTPSITPSSAPTHSAPECPVCMEPMAPPVNIYNCLNGHIVCGVCKPRMTICTICRKAYMGRATAMEQMLREMFKTQ